MNQIRKVLFSAFFITHFSFFFPSYASPVSTIECPELADFEHSQLHSGTVQWIVDGDTLHTQKGRKLRLLNINAPELNSGKKASAELLALESHRKLKTLVPKGSKIYWVHDLESKDSYGRELVYLFSEQGLFVNRQMVLTGLAQTLVVPPNQRYWQCIGAAEQNAKQKKLGLWQQVAKIKINPKNLTTDQKYHWVSGTITKIIDSKKYKWLILDDKLWVGIKRRDFVYFSKATLDFKIGSQLNVRGYVYYSYGQIRLNLRHPAMLLKNNKDG